MRKLFVVIVGIALTLFIGSVVIAQEIESSPSASASPTSPPTIEYSLPYPGLLPDHPLYGIKALRDKILSVLISDPIKRVEFNLLMADKRLNMGIFLSEKGKEELAESTVSKGEKYLFSATEQFAVLAVREKGLEVLTDRLKSAIAKHEEVVTQLKQKAADTHQAGYQASLDVVKDSEEKLQGL